VDIITIDFETYYDRDYSLSKLTTEAYIRDPRFEIIGVGIKVNDTEPDWYSGADAPGFLNAIDYTNAAILCHNTAFDGAILSWHCGIKPKLWLDTLSMARPLHSMTVGGSLKALATYYKLGAKGDEVVRALGMRRKDFTPEQMRSYADYCVQDVELTYKLFKKLMRQFPKEELLVIDQTIRMYTEPQLELDTDVLEQHLTSIHERKDKLLEKLGGEERAKKFLMSNPKFAGLLQAMGVQPPMKVSPPLASRPLPLPRTTQRSRHYSNTPRHRCAPSSRHGWVPRAPSRRPVPNGSLRWQSAAASPSCSTTTAPTLAASVVAIS
jgi:hypothetical protein